MHYELSSLGTVLILAVLDKMYWTTAKQQQHRAMDALRAPADDVLVADWLRAMGKAMQAEDKWVRFAEALIKDSAAVNIGLLRQLRDADVDKALDKADCSNAYKNTVKNFIVPQDVKFDFIHPANDAETTGFSSESDAKARGTKKWASQKDRPSMGRELGINSVDKLKLPEHMFKNIKHSPKKPMPGKGQNNTTEAVANCVLKWAIVKFGTVHVDKFTCDHIAEQLYERWPLLKRWGKSDRSWSDIIRHKFMNWRLGDKVRDSPPSLRWPTPPPAPPPSPHRRRRIAVSPATLAAALALQLEF